MDGAQEVERKRAAQAVSAKVDTGARECVSFGEPAEKHTCCRVVRILAGLSLDE